MSTAFDAFKWKTIGQPPKLLSRFSAPETTSSRLTPSPSPPQPIAPFVSPSPEVNPFDARMRPTLFEALGSSKDAPQTQEQDPSAQISTSHALTSVQSGTPNSQGPNTLPFVSPFNTVPLFPSNAAIPTPSFSSKSAFPSTSALSPPRSATSRIDNSNLTPLPPFLDQESPMKVDVDDLDINLNLRYPDTPPHELSANQLAHTSVSPEEATRRLKRLTNAQELIANTLIPLQSFTPPDTSKALLLLQSSIRHSEQCSGHASRAENLAQQSIRAAQDSIAAAQAALIESEESKACALSALTSIQDLTFQPAVTPSKPTGKLAAEWERLSADTKSHIDTLLTWIQDKETVDDLSRREHRAATQRLESDLADKVAALTAAEERVHLLEEEKAELLNKRALTPTLPSPPATALSKPVPSLPESFPSTSPFQPTPITQGKTLKQEPLDSVDLLQMEGRRKQELQRRKRNEEAQAKAEERRQADLRAEQERRREEVAQAKRRATAETAQKILAERAKALSDVSMSPPTSETTQVHTHTITASPSHALSPTALPEMVVKPSLAPALAISQPSPSPSHPPASFHTVRVVSGPPVPSDIPQDIARGAALGLRVSKRPPAAIPRMDGVTVVSPQPRRTSAPPIAHMMSGGSPSRSSSPILACVPHQSADTIPLDLMATVGPRALLHNTRFFDAPSPLPGPDIVAPATESVQAARSFQPVATQLPSQTPVLAEALTSHKSSLHQQSPQIADGQAHGGHGIGIGSTAMTGVERSTLVKSNQTNTSATGSASGIVNVSSTSPPLSTPPNSGFTMVIPTESKTAFPAPNSGALRHPHAEQTFAPGGSTTTPASSIASLQSAALRPPISLRPASPMGPQIGDGSGWDSSTNTYPSARPADHSKAEALVMTKKQRAKAKKQQNQERTKHSGLPSASVATKPSIPAIPAPVAKKYDKLSPSTNRGTGQPQAPSEPQTSTMASTMIPSSSIGYRRRSPPPQPRAYDHYSPPRETAPPRYFSDSYRPVSPPRVTTPPRYSDDRYIEPSSSYGQQRFENRNKRPFDNDTFAEPLSQRPRIASHTAGAMKYARRPPSPDTRRVPAYSRYDRLVTPPRHPPSSASTQTKRRPDGDDRDRRGPDLLNRFTSSSTATSDDRRPQPGPSGSLTSRVAARPAQQAPRPQLADRIETSSTESLMHRIN